MVDLFLCILLIVVVLRLIRWFLVMWNLCVNWFLIGLWLCSVDSCGRFFGGLLVFFVMRVVGVC